MKTYQELIFREEPLSTDSEAIRSILESSGIFYPCEADVGVELIEDRLKHGESSGYFFCFAETGGRMVGFTAFGSIPMTKGSYDLYWIAIRQDLRNQGIGKLLLAHTEEILQRMGTERIYVETSSREPYAPTRAFYLRSDYVLEGVLKDFYAFGDHKHIYVKRMRSGE